ncbi:MAG: RloB family protein [Dysgonamonadaceae bacterium]|jgi:hypothetical protein|nr:RloB family protein [Dysgonamonadaceae bacterium]
MRTKKKIQNPKRRIFSFVVDGKCELWYLQLLKQQENLNIHLEPKLPHKKSLKDQFDLVLSLSEESEKVFWMIDLDNVQKETIENKKGEKSALTKFQDLYKKSKNNDKIAIIINNPCLEFWYLQHFEQISKYFETYSKLEKALKKHLVNYEKTEKYYKNSRQNIYQRLKPLLETAINNAKQTDNFDFYDTEKGISEMYKIFDELGIAK